MTRTSDQSVLKCSCGGGDAKTLDVLRQTSLADLAVEDFNYLVAAVNAAGGVAKTIGLPRVLIQKAIVAFNEGVAKGDYVGHPFRGNQWVDSSGAGRAGAGSGPDKGDRAGARRADRARMWNDLKVRLRAERRADPTVDKLVRQIGQQGANSAAGAKLLGRLVQHLENQNKHDLAEAVYDTAKGLSRNTASSDARAEAERVVASQINQSIDDADETTQKNIDGLDNARQAAESALQTALERQERAENYDEFDDDAKRSVAEERLENEVRQQARAARLAATVKLTLTQIQTRIKLIAAQAVNAQSLNDLRGMLGEVDSMRDSVRRSLQMVREIAGAEEIMSRNVRSPRNPRFSMIGEALKEVGEALSDVQAGIEEAPNAALELEREIVNANN